MTTFSSIIHSCVVEYVESIAAIAKVKSYMPTIMQVRNAFLYSESNTLIIKVLQ